jgi:REP element-mobilizing transposase RayT
MANTYTQLSVHAVFAVKHRHHLITKIWRDDLHRYIGGILNGEGQKTLAVGGWLDHVHIFFGLSPSTNVSDILRKVKAGSSRWINETGILKRKFYWQEGFGAFSYSRSQRDTIIKYIMNQEDHHKKITFKEEYLETLKQFEIDYKNEYLFDFFD